MIRKLFSPKTGIIRQSSALMRNADQPPLHYVMTALCNSRRFGPNRNDFASTGTALDGTSAWWASLGEGIERYCAALSDMHPQKKATFQQLQQAGVRALPPEKFRLFTDEQYQSPGFPYCRPDCTSVLHWIAGQSLVDHGTCYLPSAMVFNAYRHPDEQMTVPNMHPGVACGTNLSGALLAALYEIIERDAMMTWWLNALPMPGIAASLPETVQTFITRNKNLEVSFLWLQTDIQVPVIFCLLVDTNAQVAGGGCAARFQAETALHKAFCEAAQTWLLALDLKRGRQGNIAHFCRKGLFPPDMDKPTAAPGTHVLHNLQAYLSAEYWDNLHLIRKPKERVALADLPGGPEHRSPEVMLRILTEMLVQTGLEPVAVNLTTPDIAETGLWVVRVCIPDMIPNTPTAYPPLGLPRLRTLPARLGFARDQAAAWSAAPIPYS